MGTTVCKGSRVQCHWKTQGGPRCRVCSTTVPYDALRCPKCFSSNLYWKKSGKKGPSKGTITNVNRSTETVNILFDDGCEQTKIHNWIVGNRGGSHSDMECAEWKELLLASKTARQAEEERLSAAKLAETTKPCPNCHGAIEKNSGCNHMTCDLQGGCGHQFCWTCLGAYRTDEWKAMSDAWKLKEENFRYPCSPGECYNVPGGEPGVGVVVNELYRNLQNDW